jgi:hypothetical protein
MRHTLSVLTVTGFALLGVSMAQAADVTGKWQAEFQSPVGPQRYTFDLNVAGEKLTGKAAFERMGQTGEVELLEGKLRGSDIFFVEMLRTPAQHLRVVYAGKIVGDEMKLTRKVGDLGQQELVAKRVKGPAH